MSVSEYRSADKATCSLQFFVASKKEQTAMFDSFDSPSYLQQTQAWGGSEHTVEWQDRDGFWVAMMARLNEDEDSQIYTS